MNYQSAHRSLRRFLAIVLGAPWDGSLATEERREDLPDEQRPAGVVLAPGTPAVMFARGSVPQGDVQKAATFAVVLYPAVRDDPRVATDEAVRLAETLTDVFLVGSVGPDGVSLSAPLSVPLWDYTGVPRVDVNGAPVAGPADPVGVLNVENDATAVPVPDPDDDRRWSVTLSVRLSWWEPGRARWHAPPLEVATGSVPVFAGEPVPPDEP